MNILYERKIKRSYYFQKKIKALVKKQSGSYIKSNEVTMARIVPPINFTNSVKIELKDNSALAIPCDGDASVHANLVIECVEKQGIDPQGK